MVFIDSNGIEAMLFEPIRIPTSKMRVVGKFKGEKLVQEE
jgi:hypothetical protein